MKVRWTRQAHRDLEQIQAYIAVDNPSAAEDQLARIKETADILSTFPKAGREGRVPDTRELLVAGTKYIIVYSIQNRRVAIVAVLHAARKWRHRFQ